MMHYPPLHSDLLSNFFTTPQPTDPRKSKLKGAKNYQSSPSGGRATDETTCEKVDPVPITEMVKVRKRANDYLPQSKVA